MDISATRTAPTIITTNTVTGSPLPKPIVYDISGTLDTLAVSASRDPTQDGKLDWSVTLPLGEDDGRLVGLLPGLTLPYALISAVEQPPELPDGLDLVGTSGFTASVVVTFDGGETALVLHSSGGLSQTELSFTAQVNGSVPEGVALDQLLPVSLVLEATSPGSARGLGSREGVQVSFTISYAPTEVRLPLLNLTLEASAYVTTVDQIDGSTIVTFSTTSRLSPLPLESLAGTVQGRLDDGVVLPSASITAYVDQQREGRLNWEVDGLPGMDEARRYRPLLPVIALSAAWLTADESPDELRDGLEATVDGTFSATVILQFPQGQTLIVEAASGGLSIEDPDKSVFDVSVYGDYPSEEELAVLQTLSVPLRQADLGVLSGRQTLEQGVNVSLTITYQPLTGEAVPGALLRVDVSPAELDNAGTVKFSAVAELTLLQLPSATLPTASAAVVLPTLSQSPAPRPTPTSTPSPRPLVDDITGTLDALAVSASRDPAQDGKLDWSVTLPLGEDDGQLVGLLPGLTLPYALISAVEQPPQLPDGLDLVGTSGFTASVVVTFDGRETALVLHSSGGLSQTELSFTAQVNGSVPEGVALDQLLPVSLVLEATSPGSARGLGSRVGVQVSFTISYAPTEVRLPLLNLTLEASAYMTTVDPIDGSTIVTFSTTSRLSPLPLESLAGTVQGRLDDGVVLPSASITAYMDQQREGRLNWEVDGLPGMDEARRYRPLLPVIALSAAWLTADESPDELRDGLEATVDGTFSATVILQFPQGQTLIVEAHSGGLSIEDPDKSVFDVSVSGDYPSEEELAVLQTLSVPLRQADLGVLSGRQTLEQGVNVSLTITYQPLTGEAVPRALLRVDVSPAELDNEGIVKFSAVAELTLLQLPSATLPTASAAVVLPTLSQSPAPRPTPTPTPSPRPLVDDITGTLDALAVSASRDPAQDGKLDWSVTLPLGEDDGRLVGLLPGLTLPYALISAVEQPPELPDGLDLVGTSGFTASVVVTFDGGKTALVLHSSGGLSQTELSFTAQVNGSVPEGVALDQLLPVSLVLEATSPGSARGLESREGVQVSFTISYAPTEVRLPLLNLTFKVSTYMTTVDPIDGSTIVTFSTTSRLSPLPLESLAGTVQGRLDDGVVLPSASITAYVDQQREGRLNWEVDGLPGMDEARRYRPLLPVIALSAAWLTADESPDELRDGLEATVDGTFSATVILQFPQGQTLIVEAASSGLSIEDPDKSVFDVSVSGDYPSEEELAVLQTLSVPLRQADLGVLSGRETLEQGVNVSLIITYQPLTGEAVPGVLLRVDVSPAEFDNAGTVKFGAVAELVLLQVSSAPIITASSVLVLRTLRRSSSPYIDFSTTLSYSVSRLSGLTSAPAVISTPTPQLPNIGNVNFQLQ